MKLSEPGDYRSAITRPALTHKLRKESLNTMNGTTLLMAHRRYLPLVQRSLTPLTDPIYANGKRRLSLEISLSPNNAL